jgi:selenocysteine lyase/cysteine desulfurase
MPYDVAAVRAHFPALREGAAHFDGPGGTQTPDVVAEAVARTLTSAVANRGAVTAAERRADRIVHEARAAMGDLLGVVPEGIVFGRSATELTFMVARTLSQGWGPGDEVVVTRLDHDANVRPWVIAAEHAGAAVTLADFEPLTGELPGVDIALRGVGREPGSSPSRRIEPHRYSTGPVRAAEIAHAVGAQLYVDGVHSTAHVFTDIEASRADFWVCSPYKFLGPHLGVLGARRETLESLHPEKLVPATDTVPERFELGTLPYELLAGTTAAVDFLAGLAPSERGASRRERLASSYAALEEHEDELLAWLEPRIRALPGVRVYSNARSRTPTLLFTSDRVSPQAIRAALAEVGVNAPAGNFYAWEPSHHLGLGAQGGVRVGLAPYTDHSDVERLVAGLTDVLG